MLSSFASNPGALRGRLHEEEPHPYLSPYSRDRNRIVHSNAFKRLQFKTQVFVNNAQDHFRNRLTHSLEVSLVARSVCASLQLCSDLAEAIALAHDLGHTPFGHAGEDALNEAMKDYGGFCHNTHSLKLLTNLERQYAEFDGLNLTWESLDGIAKHNGPITKNIPAYIIEFDKKFDLELDKYSSAEAQAAGLADDIAYICHDMEDGLRARIISLDNLSQLEPLGDLIEALKKRYSDIKDERLVYELGRSFSKYLIGDLIDTSKANIAKYNIATPRDVRDANLAIINFSDKAASQMQNIKKYLFSEFYKCEDIVKATTKAKVIVQNLFQLYMSDDVFLPAQWRQRIKGVDEHTRARVISDYIAGMTDRFAIKEYTQI